MRKYSLQDRLVGKLNLAVALLAMLSVLSLFELPLLHALHHCNCENHISAAERSADIHISVKKGRIANPVINDSCPICSMGGHFDQIIPRKSRITLCFSSSATVFAENSVLHSIKLIYSRQRAPPVA